MKRCARCDWRVESQDRDTEGVEAAQHAVDAGHPLCVVDRRSLTDDETQTCEPCIGRVRQQLRDVVELYALLPGQLDTLRSVTYDGDRRGGGDEHALPGGDALVLLAMGSPGAFHGGHAVDDERDGEVSAPFELARWEDDWRLTRRESAAVVPGARTTGQGDLAYRTVVSAAGYLARHLRWAAVSHPAFDEFADDLRRLRSRLQNASGRSERTVRAPAACFDCGGVLERQWTDQGLAEDWSCARCGETYDHARYFLAVRAQLEQRESA